MAAESPAGRDREAEDLDVLYEVVTMKKETSAKYILIFY